MKGWIGFLMVALAACGTGDDTADGTRALCAEGGALNDCPDATRTPQDACWRMVDCAAIPFHHDEQYVFDWDNCVRAIERMREPQQQLVMACIAASTCDQLKLGDNDDRPCLLLGDN